MIPRQIEDQFPRILRERGKRYAEEGRVSVQPGEDARTIVATVEGASYYDVVIELREQRRWLYECTCPYAAENYLCKHIWAALLTADAEGWLPGSMATRSHGHPERAAAWRRRLGVIRKKQPPAEAKSRPWPTGGRIAYYLDADHLHISGDPLIEVRAEVANGKSRAATTFDLRAETWLNAPDAQDRQIAHLLLGTQPEHASGFESPDLRRFVIPALMYETTLRTISETGRLKMASPGHSDPQPLCWDDGPAWRVHFRLVRRAQHLVVESEFVRAGEVRPLSSARLVTAHGLVVFPGVIGRFDAARTWSLLQVLRAGSALEIPEQEVVDFISELRQLPGAPVIALPADVTIEERSPEPALRLVVRPGEYHVVGDLEAELTFDYEGHIVAYGKRNRAIVVRERSCIIHRQPEREREAAARLRALGLHERMGWRTHQPRFVVPSRDLFRVVEALTAEGWLVEADGKQYRASSRNEVSVNSGIDWFDLHGGAQFGDQHVALPQLLGALRRREKFVVLDDGSLGLLPMQWLRRLAGVAQMGAVDDAGAAIRFTRAQTTLLDALLATLPEPRVDETFQRMRDELADFTAIAPAAAVPSFTGTLRQYQREGLGWMNFLRHFGLGGCLADDMGLGKTVQVLALLEQQRCNQAGPALVVVPRSLVFNWREEAARFAPLLRVRDYTGMQRRAEALDPAEFDVLLTTYGTLRRDAEALRAVEFDYIVLDEAQAIKNAKTASAKATRLLRGRNRLALSGTPIENRLDELWSLFDFLNPGMLGASSAFTALRKSGRDAGAEQGRAVLARALRPFLLRRTKEQVAPELPPRVEQTLIVELEPEQRTLYNELRDHYRNALLPRVDRVGVKRVQIEILEALLRLRQAACHTGLIDSQRKNESSAKLDVLVDQLDEIVAEGHKALVFSQFTSFLSLVRSRLDDAGLVYEYLDGQTRDRQERVQRFQSDPNCPIFLISLRAGGYGLNLTAADYVFVLDPWWNPAVEAQAIDRTHRIGQERPVLAVRLIARDTVEEKVLELQRHKRDLADAILGGDSGGLAGIGREELALLLE